MKALILALTGAAALSAQPKWINMQNETFRMYSTANERDSRAALNYFERVRGFFEQLTGAPPVNPVPIYVVMFGNPKEYEAYRFNEFAIAYYSGNSARDFIVLGKTGEQTAQVATHEYTHLVMRHYGLDLPPWLNEGMAEVFSTMHALGGDTLFGNIIPGRLQAAQREKWVPLETIVTAGRDSEYYNETKRASSLYNQSWALVHMLMTTDRFRPQFWDVVRLVDGGKGSVEALEQVYGMPFPKLEAELKSYISGMSFKQLVAKIRLEGIDKIPAQPANMFDVRTLLADLLMGLPKKQEEARKRFEELTREDAKRPEPWASLGYLAWRDGKTDDAVAHFGKSYELGNRSPKLLWDYGRLAQGKHPEEATKALTDLIEVDKANTDARISLAMLHLSARRYPEALAMARTITKVKTVEQRDGVLYVRAVSALQTGDRVEAEARARELKRLTKNDAFVKRADDMLRFLTQPQAPVAAANPQQRAAPQEIPAELVERPRLSQRDAEQETRPVTRSDLEMILQDVRGRLVQMDCGNPARLVLETPEGRKTFLILQPERLIVTGKEGGAQFSCGAQQPAPELRLQFTIAPEGSDADGVVRAVHF